MTFLEKLTAAVHTNRSLLCVGLDPDPSQIPEVYRRHSSQPAAAILAWNLAVVEQTADKVCAYKPNIAFYEAMGPAGLDVLRQTLAAIPESIPVILDAKRGDIGSTAVAYAKACFDVWGVDAVTLNPYLGRDSVAPFAAYEEKGLFVLCHTSNPGAQEFQALPVSKGAGREPLYHAVARQAVTWSPQVGLVVGGTYPGAMAQVRELAPEAWILVPGIGAQGGDLAAVLDAGLRDDGMGLILSASRSVCHADNPGEAAETLRTQIELLREPAAVRPTMADSRPRHPDSQSLIAALADLNAVRFGKFTLASGIHSPFYIDLRLLVSAPEVLAQAAAAYARILAGLPCDRIAGVPYAALPIATAVSLASGVPLIYPRKEAKAHGLGKDIEGRWEVGDRVVIIEDLITSGGSTIASAQRLREAGLVVEHAIVLIDREQGGVEKLAAAGITAHSVFRLTDLLAGLVAAGRLDEEKQREVLAFVRGS